jgi:hypothetical protein
MMEKGNRYNFRGDWLFPRGFQLHLKPFEVDFKEQSQALFQVDKCPCWR